MRVAEVLYKCLEPYGSIYTLEQLIAAAKKRNYESTFKREKSATVRESLLYHLNRFKKRGFVRVVEDTPK
jgi:negative regulator of sigma E activity